MHEICAAVNDNEQSRERNIHISFSVMANSKNNGKDINFICAFNNDLLSTLMIGLQLY